MMCAQPSVRAWFSLDQNRIIYGVVLRFVDPVHPRKIKPSLVGARRLPQDQGGNTIWDRHVSSPCAQPPTPGAHQVSAPLSLNTNTESLRAAARTGPQEPCLSLVPLFAEVSATELPPPKPPTHPLGINLT